MLVILLLHQLRNTNFTFSGGDSSSSDTQEKMTALCDRIDDVISGKTVDIHVIVDDIAGNSYIQVRAMSALLV